MHHPAAVAFLLGDTSPEVLADLRARILHWMHQEGDRPVGLHRYIGLGGPCAARGALRDAYLIQAADLLPGSRYARCCAIAERARTMNVRLFPCWLRDGVPAGATAFDRLLFSAREFGEELPQTDIAYRRLINEDAEAA